MTININTISRLLLSAILIVAGYSCIDDEFNELCDDDGIKLALSLSEVDRNEIFSKATRNSLEEEDENRINFLRVYIFDEEGEKLYYKQFDYDEIRTASNNKSRTRSSQTVIIDKDLKLPSEKNVTIYALGNTAYEDVDFKNKNGETVKGDNIQSEEELKSIYALHKTGNVFRNEGYLMFAAHEQQKVPSKNADNKTMTIRLRRLDAKVTINIKPNEKIHFITTGYKLHNVPRTTKLFQQNPGEKATTGTADTWDSFGEDKDKYFNTDEEEFEGHEGKVSTLTFYMYENRHMAKQKIDESDPLKAYRMRTKQVKIPTNDADNHNKGNYVENGETVYAPNLGTYIDIYGFFSDAADSSIDKAPDDTQKEAYVKYRIYLGYTDKDDPANDYFIERDKAYTYNITINGVDNIEVEAKDWDKNDDKEIDSGAEGTIIESAKHFTVDAHYDQVLLRFSREDINIFKEEGKRNPKAKLYFSISTPYTGFREELYQLTNEDGSWVDWDKKIHADANWLKFYFHRENIDSKTRMKKYTDTGIYLHNTVQFLNKLVTNEDMYWDDGYCYVTCYVNEYYYDKHPTQGTPVHFSEFTNCMPRSFSLIGSSESINTSQDKQSHYQKAIFTISQLPIMTIFTNDADGRVWAWGVESIDENPDMNWAWPDPNKHLGIDVISLASATNGWANNHTYYRFRKENRYDNMPKYDPIWNYTNFAFRKYEGLGKAKGQGPFTFMQVMTDDGKMTLNEKYLSNDTKTCAKTAVYLPFLRNRDENRDDLLSAEEMKWFIPSIGQLAMLANCQSAMQYGNKKFLYNTLPLNPGTNNKAGLIYSSTSAQAAAVVEGKYYNNTNCLIKGVQGSTTLQNLSGKHMGWINYKLKGGSCVDRECEANTLLVRFLGKADKLSIDYKAKVMNAPVMVRNEVTETRYRKFYPDGIDSKALRNTPIRHGELPAHYEDSRINAIYRGGFEVAAHMVDNDMVPKEAYPEKHAISNDPDIGNFFTAGAKPNEEET